MKDYTKPFGVLFRDLRGHWLWLRTSGDNAIARWATEEEAQAAIEARKKQYRPENRKRLTGRVYNFDSKV